MKCIKNKLTKEILRVKDEVAAERVKNPNWEYCRKKEWKSQKNKENKE